MQRRAAPSQKRLSISNKENIGTRKRACVKKKEDDNQKKIVSLPANNCLKGSSHEDFITKILCKPFRVPMANYNGGRRVSLGIRKSTVRRALHDPNEENSLVLFEPDIQIQPVNDPASVLVHVVVDPCLGAVLRPHQREGVQFMYECVTGMKANNAFGCIMADDMGLGKTLQCVSLVWTLLKQGPEAKPIINNCIIAAPASLVKNWANEFEKWLKGKVSMLVIDGGQKDDIKKKLRQFMNGNGRRNTYSLLMISYETFRLYSKILNAGEVGLIICDEGHRLKNMQNQTYVALNELKTKRRIIVSGTPIQNDLTEYFSLLNFVTPGVLGTQNEFRRNFGNVIERGRDAGADEEEKMMGQEKLYDLAALVNKFIIRRTAAINKKYLPSKVIEVVFCYLSPLQIAIYNQFLKSKDIRSILKESDSSNKGPKGKGGSTLTHILDLKKLCNHPMLIYDKLMEESGGFEGCKNMLPANFSSKTFQPEFSGKLKVLDGMLALIKTTTSDKIVLVSNYTQTLDLFVLMCKTRNYGFVRLDGSLSIKKRQQLIDKFNDPRGAEFVFLLSSKAGGCGLNLIGANRLILYDPDWNPATDLQAMARVWRDGQKKKCFIYRMVSTGTIEEKIFQRQSHKQALSSCVVDKEDNVERHFTVDNLKELFVYNANTLSDTHDTFKCKRCVGGMAINNQSMKTATDNDEGQFDESKWDHYTKVSRLEDNVLKKAAGDQVSFVFHNQFD